MESQHLRHFVSFWIECFLYNSVMESQQLGSILSTCVECFLYNSVMESQRKYGDYDTSQ